MFSFNERNVSESQLFYQRKKNSQEVQIQNQWEKKYYLTQFIISKYYIEANLQFFRSFKQEYLQ